MKKSSTTKRKPAKGTGASAKRATTPSATKGKAAAPAKGARKGRAHVEPNAAPPAPAEATPPPPTRVASAATLAEMEESLIPGDPVDGYRLARAIRYAAKVTPKEDGLVVFTHLEGPLPLVSGHDQRRAHTAFFGAKSAFHLHAAVPRDEALALADLLDGLSNPRVRLGADGVAVVRHGTAQPAVRFDLGHRDITQRWLPPTQEGRRPAIGPLRVNASWQAAACRWGSAIARTHQSADGIEWIELSDFETGELLARAVLAEDGKDLYPEDSRQTEIPGSRTAGRWEVIPPPRTNTEKMGAAVQGAVDDLFASIPAGTTMTVRLPGRDAVVIEGRGDATTAPASEDDEAEVAIDGDEDDEVSHG